MRQRKKLLRAALILKTTLLTFREVLYDMELTKIEFRAGVLSIYPRTTAWDAPWISGSFPDHLVTNAEHKETVLTVSQCGLAMALLGPLTRRLLAGVASTIEAFDLTIGRRPVVVMFIPGSDATTCPHTVLKVERLTARETWILDTTGCQYGYREVLVPYDRYMEDRRCRNVQPPRIYKATETNDLEFLTAIPSMNDNKAFRDHWIRERQHRWHFTEFIDIKASQDLLNGRQEEFEDKLALYKSELELHLLRAAK